MSAPELRVQQSIATALRLVHHAAAVRARIVLPQGDDEPATIVELAPHAPLLIQRPEGTVEVPHQELPHDQEPDVPMPATPELAPFPPFEVDVAEGTVTGMIGQLPGIAAALRTLATAIGGSAIVAAEFATTAPPATLGVVARAGEPVVAVLGDETFEIPGA